MTDEIGGIDRACRPRARPWIGARIEVLGRADIEPLEQAQDQEGDQENRRDGDQLPPQSSTSLGGQRQIDDR